MPTPSRSGLNDYVLPHVSSHLQPQVLPEAGATAQEPGEGEDRARPAPLPSGSPGGGHNPPPLRLPHHPGTGLQR